MQVSCYQIITVIYLIIYSLFIHLFHYLFCSAKKIHPDIVVVHVLHHCHFLSHLVVVPVTLEFVMRCIKLAAGLCENFRVEIGRDKACRA